MPLNFLRHFLKLESASGAFLFAGALLALILDNSSLAPYYESLFKTPFSIQLIHFKLAKPLLFWINEGLMTLFFLLVGLELKREFIQGELQETSKIILPAFAALGGMLIPALIYLLINLNHPETLKGWPIPVATDIAFALGVLSLFGKRVPIGLKLFLMSLAVFDDLGAIIIIALLYSNSLSYFSLLLACFSIVGLYLLSQIRVKSFIPYVLIGFILWLCFLESGVHATIAGVVLALMIPAPIGRNFEKRLHPWVAFVIMPLFAIANAGVSFSGIKLSILIDYVSLGVILGLVFGKQIGVFSFAWIVIRTGWSHLPKNTTWEQLYGVSLLCGIGFTMSLFLGTLAFEHDNLIYLTQVRLGVLVGSGLSGMIGAMILFRAFNKMTGGRRFEAS